MVSQVPSQNPLQKLVVTGPNVAGIEKILTPEALDFIQKLEEKFGPARRELLSRRAKRQKRFDSGEKPDFLPETSEIRKKDWKITPVPEVLQDRRTEITGPVDRKMMINALNSGAKMFMADFEDASSPTFENMIQGQINMQDYANGDLTFEDPGSGKQYALNEQTAIMIVRMRGWHLDEAHIELDGRPISGSLCDFGLHFFHNARQLIAQNRGPFYYIPKLESHLEARLWNDVFVYAQDALGIPQGTIKGTVLIETLPAVFEMDEILYELRNHAAGLNCGRWDYIFSYIKTLRNHGEYTLPDRSAVTMDKDFLLAYSQKLIEVCHRRGAHAMGGMAAQIPVKNDEAANAAALDKVRADKEREVKLGHDGTWVAHPALVPVAMNVFDAHMTAANQIDEPYAGPEITQEDLLKPHSGDVTENGIRTNISVAIEYTTAWLTGRGAVPIHNLMEDAATAEICRTQIWQWLKHGATVKQADGNETQMSRAYFDEILEEEVAKLKARFGADFDTHPFAEAIEIFVQTATADDFFDFLTLPAYQHIIQTTP